MCVAVLLPGAWLVRNTSVLGSPTPTITTTGGYNLWIGNHEGASGSQKRFTIPRDLRADIEEIRERDGGDDFELRVDSVFRAAAVESITSDPVGTAVRDVKKLGLLLAIDVYDPRNLNPLYLGPYAVVAICGIVGMCRWWRRRPEGDNVRWLVAGYLAYSVAVPALFFALARYRLPVEAMLIIFGAGWLADWSKPAMDANQLDPGRDDQALSPRADICGPDPRGIAVGQPGR